MLKHIDCDEEKKKPKWNLMSQVVEFFSEFFWAYEVNTFMCSSHNQHSQWNDTKSSITDVSVSTMATYLD